MIRAYEVRTIDSIGWRIHDSAGPRPVESVIWP